ncbi:MAG: valine--tRNA ligase [Patescibacteria group bacterium]|nr:valine--tRNA ligase [Patescibacteria group bacterium]
MDEKLLKPYDPGETEGRIYRQWEEGGFFTPGSNGATPTDEKFSMALPPPNVTGELHMGHAAMLTIEDIMTRFARMRGKYTLWLPGTDHAAIATQSKVEKEIRKKEKLNRHDLGREEFLKRVNAFAQESHNTIINQTKKMGSSLDWTREAFTLDEQRSLAVRTAFKQMYDAGLIYRGHRIVNWDPKGQTTISDDEVVYEEEKANFYYFKYGPFTIGTARPETKFGDKYVVMHPGDKRYAEYKHGQKIDLEWINGPITATIIKDESIDMEFGTGVMTITPWHSNADFAIAERHNLDKEQIIDKYGKLLPIAGEFAGLKITEARPKLVEKLRKKGLLGKEEPYTHNIARAERTNGLIEPQIMQQWFVAVEKPFPFSTDKIKGIGKGQMITLKEVMKKVVDGGQINIIPDHFAKTYHHWIDNLHDWCISRQIWYGHGVPVYYRKSEIQSSNVKGQDCKKCAGPIVSIEKLSTCPDCKQELEQDPDTLDTWFSSGLWTFSTLGWPHSVKASRGTPTDLELFHPTTILETGYDILFFWVARMILMSGFLLGDVPFRTVYLHGLVRDQKNRKLSKSLGNAIDPLEMIEQYGADASRMSLIIGTAPGNDSKIWPDKIKAYKHFANKIWNASRFVMENDDDERLGDFEYDSAPTEDRKTIDDFKELATGITVDMENHRFYLAGEKIYHYFWHTFADIIIENCKQRIKEGRDAPTAKTLLVHLLKQQLKLLHPFMPFITEEIWGLMGEDRPLIIAPWPIK